MPQTLPAGTYIVGDPCYTMDNDAWNLWLDAANLNSNRNLPDMLVAPFNGALVAACHTMHGDGTYTDRQRRNYGSDAGLIGAVPLIAASKRPQLMSGDLHHVVTFEEDFTVYRDGGVIHIGHITIDTDPDIEDDPYDPFARWDSCDDGFDDDFADDDY